MVIMVSALVLVNCHFPFDPRIMDEISSVPSISDIYRTEGRYDLLVKVTAESEKRLKEVIMESIDGLSGVDATISLTIAEKHA